MPGPGEVSDAYDRLISARRSCKQLIIILKYHGCVAVECIGLENRLRSAGCLDGMIAIAALVVPLGDKVSVSSLTTTGFPKRRRIGGSKPQFQIAIAKTAGIILRPDSRNDAEK